VEGDFDGVVEGDFDGVVEGLVEVDGDVELTFGAAGDKPLVDVVVDAALVLAGRLGDGRALRRSGGRGALPDSVGTLAVEGTPTAFAGASVREPGRLPSLVTYPSHKPTARPITAAATAARARTVCTPRPGPAPRLVRVLALIARRYRARGVLDLHPGCLAVGRRDLDY
jgi:hypothetical protein